MPKPAILALIRQILTVAGTALVAKGYVQASDIEPVIGALVTIGSLASATMFGMHNGGHTESRETCAGLHFCVS